MTEQAQTAQAQDIDVNLTLKLSTINTILAALDEIPHKFSRGIIDTIHQQAGPQVQAAQAPAPTEAPVSTPLPEGFNQ